MKERKGNAFALFFGFLLLVSGCAVMLYPHINALWMDHAMRRDAEEFFSFVEIPQKRLVRMFSMACVAMLMVVFMAIPAYATGGNVSGAITDTWNAAQGQIKDIVNNVVFPVIDMVLAILLFVKIATAYMDYRKHGQFEFTAPAILFACLLFSLTAPSYIWNIL